MSTIIVAQRMWQRRDTAANWEGKNPVLAAGEIGVELGATPEDTKFKIGTGAHPWNSLPYFSGGGSGDAGTIDMRVADGFIQYSTDEGATWTNIVAIEDLKGAKGDPGAPGDPGPIGPPGPASSAYFGGTFDGGNVDIAPGAFCDVRVPYGFTATKVTVLGDRAGDLIIGVWVTGFASFPPTSADSIVGANPPRLAGAMKYEDAELAGWDTEFPPGAVVRFYVISSAGVTRATVLIEGIRE